MAKNDFDIDFDFEKEYGFDPKAILDSDYTDDELDLSGFSDDDLNFDMPKKAAAKDEFSDFDLDSLNLDGDGQLDLGDLNLDFDDVREDAVDIDLDFDDAREEEADDLDLDFDDFRDEKVSAARTSPPAPPYSLGK